MLSKKVLSRNGGEWLLVKDASLFTAFAGVAPTCAAKLFGVKSPKEEEGGGGERERKPFCGKLFPSSVCLSLLFTPFFFYPLSLAVLSLSAADATPSKCYLTSRALPQIKQQKGGRKDSLPSPRIKDRMNGRGIECNGQRPLYVDHLCRRGGFAIHLPSPINPVYIYPPLRRAFSGLTTALGCFN